MTKIEFNGLSSGYNDISVHGDGVFSFFILGCIDVTTQMTDVLILRKEKYEGKVVFAL